MQNLIILFYNFEHLLFLQIQVNSTEH